MVENTSTLSQSPLVWALECVRLPTPEGTAGFRPYSYQAVLLTDRSPRRLCLKARQTGMTTTVAIDVAHEAIFCPRSLCLLVSRDQGAAAHVLDIVYGIFDELDDPPRLLKRNEYEVLLENGSRIVSQPATAKSGRGYRATSVVLDELAFAEYDTRIYRAVNPTLSRGGRLTVLSTPDGQANLFYRLWQGQEGGDWSRQRIHWRDCPRFDGGWYERERPKYSSEEWASEFECDFMTSGSCVFGPDDVDAMREGWVGLQPAQLGCRYSTAWDIGRKKDATVGITVDVTGLPYQVVAYERLVRAKYALIETSIDARAELYGGETWVESNSIGDPVLEAVTCGAKGFATTSGSKEPALKNLQRLVENGELKCGVPQVLSELKSYQWEDERLVQDSVMALAIALDQKRPQKAKGSIFWA
jgi:hypothetical protein